MLEWNGEQRHHLPMGRARQLGNGGLNKTLMPTQAASLSPYNMMEGKREKERKGAVAL